MGDTKDNRDRTLLIEAAIHHNDISPILQHDSTYLYTLCIYLSWYLLSVLATCIEVVVHIHMYS